MTCKEHSPLLIWVCLETPNSVVVNHLLYITDKADASLLKESSKKPCIYINGCGVLSLLFSEHAAFRRL